MKPTSVFIHKKQEFLDFKRKNFQFTYLYFHIAEFSIYVPLLPHCGIFIPLHEQLSPTAEITKAAEAAFIH